MHSLDSLFERFRRRERLALARLLTWAADVEMARQVRAAFAHEPLPNVPVIAFTGSGGVGKSTLIGRLIEHVRSQGKTVAVLACDPQSPLSGGALLGDRVRMNLRADDDGVFVRSVAASGGREAVADNLDLMIEILARFGFDVVLVETGGAGQGDTAVRQFADVVVLLVQPEAGDELQWEKAGILEIADIVAVNKADLPAAERVEAQLRAMLHLPGCPPKPVLRISGSKGEGLAELWSAIETVFLKKNPPQN